MHPVIAKFVMIVRMVARADIQNFVDRVVQRFQPERVILFGSYAYGEPNEDSDVDLMVIMPHRGSDVSIANRIRMACPRHFAMDLLVRAPDDLHRRVMCGDPFFREVITRGVILYDICHATVG